MKSDILLLHFKVLKRLLFRCRGTFVFVRGLMDDRREPKIVKLKFD